VTFQVLNVHIAATFLWTRTNLQDVHVTQVLGISISVPDIDYHKCIRNPRKELFLNKDI